jgi:hypothetical protein
MTTEEADAIRGTCAELVRMLHNMSEALATASKATRMCAEAAEVVERDLIAISALVESDNCGSCITGVGKDQRRRPPRRRLAQ